MGNESPTMRLNNEPIEALSFDEAVRKLQRDPVWSPWIKWNQALGSWTMWACKLFPDEESARAVFGH